jgi:hypothetical protein
MSDSHTARLRARIDEANRAQALQGEDETTSQARATVAAAKTLIDELEKRRAAFVASGNFTDRGVKAALKSDVETALKALNELQGTHVTPRRAALQPKLAAMPEPSLPALNELERHRLLIAYTNASPSQRREMLHNPSPKLATAILEEDDVITKLGDGMRAWLRTRALPEDAQSAPRQQLRAQLAALDAADTVIAGAAISARSYGEDDET